LPFLLAIYVGLLIVREPVHPSQLRSVHRSAPLPMKRVVAFTFWYRHQKHSL